jgi:monovalent cation/hydrogen antiporter
VVLGWSGLRGAISLAAALSIPALARGRPFPGRDLIVFTTFCVVVATLVGQGTSLPWLLGRLHLVGSRTERDQHRLAHRRLAEAALGRLDRWEADEELSEEMTDILRGQYQRRLDQVREEGTASDSALAIGTASIAESQHQLLVLQRQVVRRLHRAGRISFAVMRDVERELDLEQAQLDH